MNNVLRSALGGSISTISWSIDKDGELGERREEFLFSQGFRKRQEKILDWPTFSLNLSLRSIRLSQNSVRSLLEHSRCHLGQSEGDNSSFLEVLFAYSLSKVVQWFLHSGKRLVLASDCRRSLLFFKSFTSKFEAWTGPTKWRNVFDWLQVKLPYSVCSKSFNPETDQKLLPCSALMNITKKWNKAFCMLHAKTVPH